MSGTTNLNAVYVVASQTQKEVTLNAAMSRFDAAITGVLAVSVSAGNAAPTQEQVRAASVLSISGATTSGRTVTWPAVQRPFYASLDAASTHKVSVVRGTAAYDLFPGMSLHLFSDGTTNSLVRLGEFGPFRTTHWIRGVVSNGEVVARWKLTEPVTLLSDLAGWTAVADTAAAAETIFEVRKNGSAVGTLTWAAAGTTPTMATTSNAAQSFAAGDFFDIKGPATADASLADISISTLLVRA